MLAENIRNQHFDTSRKRLGVHEYLTRANGSMSHAQASPPQPPENGDARPQGDGRRDITRGLRFRPRAYWLVEVGVSMITWTVRL
jgi:hypothetical protein